jgi:hypothetical protein
MTSSSVLTVVSVRDDMLRRALARHLARIGVDLVLDGASLRRRAIRAPTILLTGESRVADDLADCIADGWAARRWRQVAMISIGDGALAAEPERLRAIFSEWDDRFPPPDNSVDARMRDRA